MRLRTVVFALVVLAAAATCVRLGLWQLERLEEKRALNAELRATLASDPLDVAGPAPPFAELRGRRVRLRGAFDESRQVVLTARFHQGEPGVELVTPLVLEGGGTVLVNRGWAPAADAVSRDPAEFPRPGRVEVVGVAQELGAGHGRGHALRPAASAPGRLVWTAGTLDRDSLATRIPAPLADWIVREQPAPEGPALPVRTLPEPHDEGTHLGYAVQWFLFGALLVIGAVVLARLRRSPRPAAVAPSAPR